MTVICISGRPSSPTLTVVAATFQTATFTISPPSYAGQCVLNYTITATSSDGSVVPGITVEVTNSENAVSENITQIGYDFCSNAYNFTVVADTLTFTGDAGFLSFGPYPNLTICKHYYCNSGNFYKFSS